MIDSTLHFDSKSLKTLLVESVENNETKVTNYTYSNIDIYYKYLRIKNSDNLQITNTTFNYKYIDDNNNTKDIASLFVPTYFEDTTYTNDNSITKDIPDWCKIIRFILIGGGGGGQSESGGILGGGGGEFVYGKQNLLDGTGRTFTYTIGKGGTGNDDGYNGEDGKDTTITYNSSTTSATGGKGNGNGGTQTKTGYIEQNSPGNKAFKANDSFDGFNFGGYNGMYNSTRKVVVSHNNLENLTISGPGGGVDNISYGFGGSHRSNDPNTDGSRGYIRVYFCIN